MRGCTLIWTRFILRGGDVGFVKELICTSTVGERGQIYLWEVEWCLGKSDIFFHATRQYLK